MKWHNVNETPVMEEPQDQSILLLGTNGKKVALIAYMKEEKTYMVDDYLRPLTHWMYPSEVFSPRQMMKMFDILDNKSHVEQVCGKCSGPLLRM